MTAPRTAAHKLSCPACGGEAEWNPSQQALVCPYCGTKSPADLKETTAGDPTIIEHDLGRALRGISDEERGWQAEKTSVRCQSCQAISVFEAKNVSQACDFCGATALVPQADEKDPFRPETLLPMKVSQHQVRAIAKKWYGSRFWAPSSLRKKALTDKLHGVYLPYWTFDAQVEASWHADSGTYYYETQRVNGKNVSVRRTRWRPTSGHVSHFFDDELVAASKGVHQDLLSQVEPFDTTELELYDAKFLSGWVVERYQIDLISAAQASRAKMEVKLRRMCSSDIPGDTYRNLHVAPEYAAQTFKHVLVPIWLLSYRYGTRNFQVVINGHSGKIAGEAPTSWLKVAFAIAMAVCVLILFLRFV